MRFHLKAAAKIAAIGLVLVALPAIVAVAALTFVSETYFAGGTSDEVEWIASNAGTTNGTIVPNRDGWLVTTNAAANKVYGLIGDPNAALGTANFLKTGDSPSFRFVFKTPASVTAHKWLIGLINAVPSDAGDPNNVPTLPGHYNNASLTLGAWFWYSQADDSGKLCVGYRDASGVNVSKVVVDVTLAVATEYDLQIAFNSARVPTFTVNGEAVHVGTAPLANVALFPAAYTIGNGATAYYRYARVTKAY